MQAIQLGSNIQQLLSPGIDTLPELLHEELRGLQLQDSVVSKSPNDDVQDAFRWASYPQEITSLTTAEVKAICQLHIDWECSTEMQAIQLGSNIQQLLSPGIDTLPELLHEELRGLQLQDSVVSK
ncbi:unnamed protein product, partial [Coregonus sp. 'balchen']